MGRAQGVEAKNVVGAIANEAGLDSGAIGHIKFHDTYSTVDLPEGLPKPVLRHLQKVRVCGQQLQLSVADETRVGGPHRSPKPRKSAATKGPGRSASQKKGVRKKDDPKRRATARPKPKRPRSN